MLLALSDYAGGMEKHVVELCEQLCTRGHSISLICGDGYPNLKISNLRRTIVSTTLSRYNPKLYFRIAQEILKFSPDIIHCHGNKAVFVLGLIPRISGARRIATVHGLKKINWAYRKLDHCIGVSQKITDQLLEKNIRATRVYNGTDFSPELTPTRLDLANSHNKPFRWALVGRLVEVKGFELGLNAISRLEKHEAVIIGDGPERESLEALAASLGIEERTHFLGFRKDVLAQLSMVDGTLITSFKEGFSYVFLESMLCGTPVVSTDVPVANEILPNEYICKDRDPSALAQIMEAVRLKRDSGPIQLDQVERCRSELTLQAMVEQIETLYEDS
jgi:glycosyltransferase involved in cell wall biosynthesis